MTAALFARKFPPSPNFIRVRSDKKLVGFGNCSSIESAMRGFLYWIPKDRLQQAVKLGGVLESTAGPFLPAREGTQIQGGSHGGTDRPASADQCLGEH